MSGINHNSRFIKISIKDSGLGLKPQSLETLQKRLGSDKFILQYGSEVRDASANSDDDLASFMVDMRLAICSSLVHQLGGDMWVNSEFGQGSEFIFTLDTSYSFVKDK